MGRFAAFPKRMRARAIAVSVGVLATVYVAACVLPGEPSGAERIQFTLDSATPYRVPLAGVVEPLIAISADGRVLRNPSYRLETLDAGVVRVDSTERRLLGVARGTASVHVTYLSGIGTPDTVFPVQVVVSRVAVDPPSLTFTQLGATTRLSGIAYDANGAAVPNVALTWSSANPQVATVNDTGLVRAVNEGTVAITAEADSVKGLASITVTQVAAQVHLLPELDTLHTVGRSVQFHAFAFDDSGGAIRTARPDWSSSNASVARVDSAGVATATGGGTASIIARVGTAADTATLVVAQVLRLLTVTPRLDTLTAIQDTGRIVVQASDSSGAEMPPPTVTWVISDTTIATVDAAGLVTAVANGAVLVSVSSAGHSAFATVLVRQEVAAGRVSQDSVALTGAGDTVRLSAVAVDRNGFVVDGAAFTWRSSNGFVATVDTAGLVTAQLDGRTSIVATPEPGGRSDTATVSVTGAPPGDLSIQTTTTGIQPDPDGYTVGVDEVCDYYGSSCYYLWTAPVGVNGTVAWTGPTGTHTVELLDVAGNCSVAGGNRRTVSTSPGVPTYVTFSVTCVQTGSVRVTTATTGADLDPDGYGVEVNGRQYQIGVNDNVTIAGLRPGNYVVTLTGVAGNCTLGGPGAVTVGVNGGVTADVAFAVTCAPLAAIRVTVATTGVDPDGDGYLVTAAGTGGYRSGAVAPNGAVVIDRLVEGTYTVTLDGVAVNCAVTGTNPLAITVAIGDTADAAFAVACTTAELLAVAMSLNANTDIYLVKSNGTGLVRLTSDAAADVAPAWSASSGKIAFVSERDGNSEIYVMNPDGSGQLRLTANSGTDRDPAWSPDGLKLAFWSDRTGNPEIYVMNADGSSPVRLTVNSAEDIDPAWSPDGLRIGFASNRGATDFEIYRMNTDGSGVTRITFSGGNRQPDWSPAGTKLVYSHVTCDPYYGCYVWDLGVINADGSGEGALPTGEGYDPVWSPDGRWIAFGRYNVVFGIRGDGTGLVSMVTNAFQPAWRR